MEEAETKKDYVCHWEEMMFNDREEDLLVAATPSIISTAKGMKNGRAERNMGGRGGESAVYGNEKQ